MLSFRTQAIIILCLVAVSIGAFREWSVRPNGHVMIHVLDIGQGDSSFIVGPHGEQIVIDGGPDLSALGSIGKHMSFFDRTIDVVVVSHPHLDHLFALPDLLRRYRVNAFIFTAVDDDLPRYQEIMSLLKEKHIPVLIADPNKDIDFGNGFKIDVLWPPPIYIGKEDPSGGNDSSVVLKLIYGEDSMLYTGDMEAPEEAALLSSGTDVSADILKVAHHGSRTSTGTGFLLAVNPSLAVISAGRTNSFNHPHPWIIKRLAHFGIPVRVTAQEGEITLEMDGK